MDLTLVADTPIDFLPMASDHPFQMLFETFGRLPASHADTVNKLAFERLTGVLSVPVEKAGRCILLRAPRAGHGKTHLLSRVQNRLGNTHEFIPLQAASGYRIDAPSVIDDTLRRLVRALPASSGLSVLDLVTRRLFSQALQPLVKSGEVPCQDREGALAALQNKPVETFDFHHPNAVTAHWARENFEVLGPRLSLELSQRSDLPLREVSFWVNALFRFASTPLEEPTRARVLSETVFTQAPVESDGDSMERLSALLGLLTSLMRVVLVADDLEGFSADETAALRFAAFLGSLRQSAEKLDVILSLNQDIWNSAFVPRLSGGLADRLSEVVIELKPLEEEDMIALIESRMPGRGRDILGRIDLSEAGTHSRGLIKAAASVWDKPDDAISAVPFPNTEPEVIPALERDVPVAAPVQEEIAAREVEKVPAFVPPVFAQPATPVASASSDLAFKFEPQGYEAPQEPFFILPPAPPAALVSRPEAEVVPVVVMAEPKPVRVEPEAPVFQPFSAPRESPAIEVASQEVLPDQAWPAPTFSVPSPDNPFARFTAVQEEKPVFEMPKFHPSAEPVEPVEPVAPVFKSPFYMEADASAQSAATPAQSFIPQPRPAPVEEPAFRTTTPVAPPPAAFVPAAIVLEPSAPPASPYGQVAAPSFQPAPPEPAPAPQPVTSAAAAGDTDRVDELLRQFRERYGRGGL